MGEVKLGTDLSGKRALLALSLLMLMAALGSAPDVLGQPLSSEACWECHAGGTAGVPALNRPAFEASVHKDLVCTACHTNVTVLPHAQTPAPVEIQICAGCHALVMKDYQQSIHGRAHAQGIREAARCADCHTAHETLPKDHADSTVFVRNLPQTCGKCHENSGLSERFGLPSRRYTTYLDSYHGISLKYGNLIAANCSSCHGSHLILAASDPNSSIHAQNLPQTCGQCHPNASENFLKGKVHVEANPSVSPGVYAVRIFYTLFISGLGLFFLLHMSLDFIRWLRRRYA